MRPPVVGGGEPAAGADAVVVGAADGPVASASFATAAAAVLNSGCLETGSQAVMVSSLAARPSRAGSSQ